MSKQLILEEMIWDAGTIYRNECLTSPLAEKVNHAGEQVFSRPGFSRNQSRKAVGRTCRYLVGHAQKSRILANYTRLTENRGQILEGALDLNDRNNQTRNSMKNYFRTFRPENKIICDV